MTQTDVLSITRQTFDTKTVFAEHLQSGLERAQTELWLADRDFADWPLQTPAFASTLQTFLRRSAAHHLRILTVDAERIAALAPRFIAVMKAHAHNAQCRVVPLHAAARFGEACSMLIADPALLVRRFHRDHPRRAADLDPGEARRWLDQFEMLWEESTPALASTTLGLG